MDARALGLLVKQRRVANRQSLRQAADDAGVSFSTMSRVEDGAQPDLATFSRLCAWLGVSPAEFFLPVAARRQDALEQAVRHIAADPRLTPAAAERITSTLRDLYGALATSTPVPDEALALHLRAATTMRPGVPARLGSLLDDMHRALTEQVNDGVV